MADGKKTLENLLKDQHKGHRKRVLKEFIDFGIPEDVRPHKVLEMILFFTIPRKNTDELALIVWNYFNKSFVRVMEATIEELIASSENVPPGTPKITEYSARHIKSILEVAKFYYSQKAKEEKWFLTKKDAATFLFKQLVDKNTETTYLLCMDNSSRFLACPKISEGDEFSVSVSPRQLVKKITQIGATNVVLAHNHPRGTALPSDSDIQATKRISFALLGVGAKLVDHIIVADKDFVSLYDSAEYRYIFEL